jgi:hypothetical protein
VFLQELDKVLLRFTSIQLPKTKSVEELDKVLRRSSSEQLRQTKSADELQVLHSKARGAVFVYTTSYGEEDTYMSYGRSQGGGIRTYNVCMYYRQSAETSAVNNLQPTLH